MSHREIAIAQPEVKTLRSEQTTELTFAQMDTNFSKITRVNFATSPNITGPINISLFDNPIDPSKFDASAPFAVVNVSGIVTEVGTSSGLNYLDSNGVPEGTTHNINSSLILTYNPKTSSIISKDVSSTASTQTMSLDYMSNNLTITGLSSQIAVFDLNIGLTWIQPNLNDAIFNPKLNNVTSAA